MIKGSLDWNSRRVQLALQIGGLPYNVDLRRMLRNIDTMVDKLSQLEVEGRRTHNASKVEEQLEQVNGAIVTLEQWIVMAALIG